MSFNLLDMLAFRKWFYEGSISLTVTFISCFLGTHFKRERQFIGVSWSKTGHRLQQRRGDDNDQCGSPMHQCFSNSEACNVISGKHARRQGCCSRFGSGFKCLKWWDENWSNEEAFSTWHRTEYKWEPYPKYVNGWSVDFFFCICSWSLSSYFGFWPLEEWALIKRSNWLDRVNLENFQCSYLFSFFLEYTSLIQEFKVVLEIFIEVCAAWWLYIADVGSHEFFFCFNI